jgi:hypothetical protein
VKEFHGESTRSHTAQRGLEKAAKPGPGDPALGWRSLVHAEDSGMRWWFEVQADDVRRFLFKLRIITGHISTRPARLEPKLAPHSTDRRLADTHLLGKPIATPPPRKRGLYGRTLRPSRAEIGSTGSPPPSRKRRAHAGSTTPSRMRYILTTTKTPLSRNLKRLCESETRSSLWFNTPDG